MMLIRCLYASRMLDPNSQAARTAILKSSRKHNVDLGITGVLISAGDCFVQILEGGRGQVSQLYNKIVSDKRHGDVTLMIFEEIEKRSFEGWSMGEVSLDQINPALLLKYSATRKIDPFNMTGTSMLAFLQDMVASGSVVCGPSRR